MRWLFLLLLVLNLFYWGRGGAASQGLNEVLAQDPPREVTQGIQLVAESKVGAREPVGRPKKDECLFLAGVQSEEQGRQVMQRLLSLDIRSKVELIERVVAMEYWLYLPPLSSRQASLIQLKELQVKKIDSYVITQGDLVNGISLGVFSRSESAEAAIQRFRKAGYEPAMRELPRTRRDYGVEIAPESTWLFDEGLMEVLTRSFPRLQYQRKACGGGLAGTVRFE
ncbi:hypothetical protein SAMN04244574_04717 [Azotobacter beijerinckii]|uniref:Sporulation related domain-containing protein n=2 Tax=Azotobacter beijerinckii TaxID=170623 RepID=A0A1I4IX44_9GAMM|nr:hypothetical protein SAMN04244571_04739 [Azotobacter beijerinckii]SFL58938.1 hypothetical protein SAMN04244574_04717 [Azotobacter beijerinckii]